MSPVIFALLLAFGSASAGYVYDVPVDAPLESLPGAALLNPKKYVWNIAITQAPITYRLTTAAGDAIEFTAPSYISDATKQPLPFGPTLRARAGDALSIKLTNDLVETEEPSEPPPPNSYEGPMATNLHTHGLHDAVGVWDQDTAKIYSGGDNNFVTIPPKKAPEDKAASFTFDVHVPRDHLPGTHWYHPHKHGSTTIQTSTSHGVIIVDDHEFWLPWNKERCGHLWAVLKAAPELVLDVQLYFFKVAMQGTPAEAAFLIEDPNYQTVSNSSNPKNPLCCDGDNGYAFKAQNQDLLLLNGGYQPRITLPSNTWQRWRMLFSGAKGWSSFQVLTPDLQPAPECELQLLNKDGIYMMKVPRLVPALVLASGSRLEVLVRCAAPAGRRYVLSATASPDPFNPGNNQNLATELFRVVQNVVATIEIGASRASAQKRAAAKAFSAQQGGKVAAAASGSAAADVNLVSESCTPLRPAYAADLRDASLAQAGYPLSRMKREVVNFSGSNGAGMNCAVNGQIFSFPDPAPLVMPLGEIVQWSFNAPRFHPMHVHVNPFQVVYMDRSQVQPNTELTAFYKEGDYYDNLLIPMLGSNAPPGQLNNTVLMRFQPGPFSGFSLMHCHYLNHEDLGCMKVVQWACPGYPNVQPQNGLCPGFKWPVPADLNGYN